MTYSDMRLIAERDEHVSVARAHRGPNGRRHSFFCFDVFDDAYVETGAASYKVFVVECFEPDHYEQAALALIDVIFDEPATLVAAPASACSPPASVDTTPASRSGR